MTVLKAILTGEGSCIYRNLLSDDFHKTAVLKKKKEKNCKLNLHSKGLYQQLMGAAPVPKFVRLL